MSLPVEMGKCEAVGVWAGTQAISRPLEKRGAEQVPIMR